MTGKNILLMLASLVVVMGENIPAMIPPKFTEAFTLKFLDDTQQVYSGKTWMQFDASDNLSNWRIDWNTDECDEYFPQATNCRFIFQRKDQINYMYFFAPQKNLCEAYNMQNQSLQIYQRQMILPEYYKGIKVIDSENYHYWHYYPYPFFKVQYYTDISQTLRPRRFTAKDYTKQNPTTQIDFLVNSYSETFNSTTVFQVPKYCLNQTNHFNERKTKSFKRFEIMSKVIQILAHKQKNLHKIQ